MAEPIIPEHEQRGSARDTLKVLLYYASAGAQKQISSDRDVIRSGLLQAIAEYCGREVPVDPSVRDPMFLDYKKCTDPERLQPRTALVIDYLFRHPSDEGTMLYEFLRPWGDMKFCSANNGVLSFSPTLPFEVKEIILHNLSENDREELTAIGRLMKTYVEKD